MESNRINSTITIEISKQISQFEIGPKIILHFGCTNNILADSRIFFFSLSLAIKWLSINPFLLNNLLLKGILMIGTIGKCV